MKALILFLIMLFFTNNKVFNQEITINYFEQEPPNEIAQIFAPDFISKDGQFVQNCCFSPDGKEFLYVLTDGFWSFSKIMYSKYTEGQWTIPDTISFSKDVVTSLVPFFSYDGQKIFFISNGRKGYNSADIWMSQRTENEWGEPERLNNKVNSENDEWEVSIAKNGNLYFSSDRPGGKGLFDIYKAEYNDGKYDTIKNLGFPINTNSADECPYIAPDESFLIFNSWKTNENFRGNNIYISYRKSDGGWTNPKDLGKAVNTDLLDIYPYITPDSGYIMFTRREKSNDNDNYSHLYWIKNTIIDSLKNTNFIPYVLNSTPVIIAETGKEFVFQIPENTFYDDDSDDTLTLSAVLTNGNDLPEWLHFNPVTNIITGTPVNSGFINIQIIATDNEGESVSDNLFINVKGTTGIEKNQNTVLQVSPNPVNDKINISLNNSSVQKFNIQLFDITGNLILTKNVYQEESINIEEFNNGIYFLCANYNNVKSYVKVMIKK